MATLYTHKSQNIAKTWLLMLLFLGIVIGVGFVFAQIYGEPTILYIAVGFSIVMNVVSYWFSDKIVLKMHRAKAVNLDTHRELYNILENLSITAGLPMPAFYIINDPAPNAFATGRDPKHAVVCVTSGIVELLDRSELEGVLAHELSHIGNRDMLISTMAVVLVGFLAIISDIFLRSFLFRGLYGGRDRNDSGGGLLLVVGLVLSILAPIGAMLIQFAISRKREFLADASGALLTRYPEGLASALKKISGNTRPLQTANNATAHLFLENPYKSNESYSKKTPFMIKLFSTHPPMQERISALYDQKNAQG